MKILARCFLMLMIIEISSVVYAQDWIPYQENPNRSVVTNFIYVPQFQPVIVYQWVPYTYQQNIVIEHQRIFCKTQTVVTRPYTQWVLQPVVVNR